MESSRQLTTLFVVNVQPRSLRRSDRHHKQLLVCTLLVTIGFAFPGLLWATHVGYTLMAHYNPGDGA